MANDTGDEYRAQQAAPLQGEADPPRRKSIRLQHYDYASAGVYFVTICTCDRELLFGTIEEGRAVLSRYGEIVFDAIEALPTHYEHVNVDCSVIMPNHIHLVIWIQDGNPSNRTLGQVICSLKSGVTRKCGRKVWQRGYYEHIVRNETDLQEIRTYIENNPGKWEEDRNNPINPKFETWNENP